MKKTIEKSSDSESLYKTSVAQELIAPHEWASLLNNFENETDIEVRRSNEKLDESEELWERLSSTRWLKVRPVSEEVSNASTVAQRPK